MLRTLRNSLASLALGLGLGAGSVYYYCNYIKQPASQPAKSPKPATVSPKSATQSVATTMLPTVSMQGVSFAAAAKRAVAASVHVQALRKSKVVMQKVRPHPMEEFFREFFGQGGGGTPGKERERAFRTPSQRAFGSGVLVSPDGYIITNQHVVAGADEIEVTRTNHVTYKAKVISSDADLDIALLKIEAQGLPCLRFGNSDHARVGDWVLAVGTPFGTKLLSATVTHGIISAKGRPRFGEAGKRQQGAFLQIDATINPGNSGGALVNLKGELIGINNAIFTRNGTFNGYGFAIPGNLVKKTFHDLQQYGTVQRGVLGVGVREVNFLRDYFKLREESSGATNTQAEPEHVAELLSQFSKSEQRQLKHMLRKLKTPEGVVGLVIMQILPNTSGARAGLKLFDVLTHVDGHPIQDFAAWEDLLITRYKPGDTIEVSFLRNNKLHTCKVTLDKAPGKPRLLRKSDKQRRDRVEVDGAVFEDLPEITQKRYQLTHGGVQLIQLVKKGQSWKKAELQEGFIVTGLNHEPIKDVRDLTRVMTMLTAGQWVPVEGIDPRIKGKDKRKGYLLCW